MGEVANLFQPDRWVRQWEEIGGRCFVGEGAFGEGGEVIPAMLEMGPRHCGHHVRVRANILRDQVIDREHRRQVIDWLLRRQATRGW